MQTGHLKAFLKQRFSTVVTSSAFPSSAIGVAQLKTVQRCTNSHLDRCSVSQKCGGPCDPFDWQQGKSKNIDFASPMESLIEGSISDSNDLYVCRQGYCAKYCDKLMFFQFCCYTGSSNESTGEVKCERESFFENVLTGHVSAPATAFNCTNCTTQINKSLKLTSAIAMSTLSLAFRGLDNSE